MTEWLELLICAACLVASGFFSGIETGIVSIHPVRLMHLVKEKVNGATMLQGFFDNSDRLLGTTLVGTNLCNVTISVLAASIATSRFGPMGESAAAVVTALMVLVFAEYLPKAWFHSRPTIRSLRFVRVLRFSEVVLHPLSVACMRVSKLIMRRNVTFVRKSLFATKEDFKHLTEEGAVHGALTHRERDMIERVFELSGKTARQIMIPRDDMIVVDTDASIERFFDLVRESSFTRIPAFDSQKGAFTGVINVFHVLSQHEDTPSANAGKFARAPLFVDENLPVDDILPLMRRHRQPLCMVHDASGAVVGMLTTEDILEEIVGAL
ncbi:MAG: hemolysin family protein [Kiritimatiellae bacterium]|nr:hemolysin family protein [Kiritimatiellia bacterium]